jgi:hypothetical protein
MGLSIWLAGQGTGGNASAVNTTQYWHIIGGNGPSTTEANTQITAYTAGTFSSFRVRTQANTVSAATTFRLRKNTAAGNSTVSIAASTTGFATDTTHTDTIAANDLINIQSVPGTGSTGTFTPAFYATDFTPSTSTDTVTRFAFSHGATSGSALNPGSVSTYYFPLSGQFFTSGTGGTTEINYQTGTISAGTFRNLSCKITANTRTSVQTVRLRKNSANSAQSLSITGNGTGYFRDSTNTDTAASADKWNYSFTTDASGTSFSTSFANISIEFLSTASPGVSFYTMGNTSNSASTQAKSTTAYYNLGGRSTSQTTESLVQLPMYSTTLEFSGVGAMIAANALTAATTVTLRKNAANTLLQASIAAAATGVISDTADTIAVTTGDLMNIAVVTGTGGGAAVLTYAAFTATATEGTGAPPNSIDTTVEMITLGNKIITIV